MNNSPPDSYGEARLGLASVSDDVETGYTPHAFNILREFRLFSYDILSRTFNSINYDFEISS